ncbi:citrate synthase-like protein [Aspergillus germanicus]
MLVTDSRTNKQYEIPIKHNADLARDFKSIKAPGREANQADQMSGGLRLHDPGLLNTTVVETEISFSLKEMWNSDFEDMRHLLVWGSYPTAAQRERLRRDLASNMLAVPDSVQNAIHAMPATTPPLPLMVMGLSAYLATMPHLIPASKDLKLCQGKAEDVDLAILRAVAGYAVVFGTVASHRKGLKFSPPTLENTYCQNLFMMSGLVDPTTGFPNPSKVSCFRRFAMLNSEHGKALAVFAALVTASALADPISCLITSVASAWGLLHFGATEVSYHALKEIGTVDRIPAFLDEVKQGHRKLFGYGHQMLPAAMLAQRIIGIMAHWREYMLTNGKLFRPSHLYTGHVMEDTIMASATETTPLLPFEQRLYSIFTPSQKRLLILTAAVASSFSPLSANIYYPALNALAIDLHVSSAQINLTITTYMHSYPALLVLRALQSIGISGIVALASAVAADIITPDERGLYMGFTSLGNILAPSLGPVLGGVICESTGWRGKKRATFSPLASLRILFHLPTALILLSNALVFASYYAVMAGIPSLFNEMYGLSGLGIGLVFIPAGLGSLASSILNGVLVDWNYHRTAVAEETVFPVVRARLQIGGPMTFLCTIPLSSYALLPNTPPLPISLTVIFLISFTITASYNVMNVLLVDLYYTTPTSAMATNNLVRCLFGAASTALVQPCIHRFGLGATYAVVSGVNIFPGDTLPMKHTHPLPQISRLGLDPRWTYLLTFVDLDVQYGDTYTVILHWYQPNMRVSHRENFWLEPAGLHTGDGEWVMPPPGLVNLTSGAEYIAPQPPPHSHHRYVYLLFRQPRGYKFPDCFGHIFPKTVEARAGFDLQQFTDVAGLQFPVAGNYFYVDNSESVTTTTHTRTSPATTPWLSVAGKRPNTQSP